MAFFEQLRKRATAEPPAAPTSVAPSGADALLEQELDVLRRQNAVLEETRKAVLNVLEDVAESEKELQQKTLDLKKFQQAVDSSFNHLIITDPKGVILYANHAAEELTGFRQDEMLGKTASLWGKQMPAAFYTALWDTIETKKSVFTGEITNRRKNGTRYLATVRISPILDETGAIQFFVGIERDITAERATQERILQHAAELETANASILAAKNQAESILNYLRAIGEAVVASDLEGRIIFMNHQAEHLTKKKLSQVTEQPLATVLSFVREKEGKEAAYHPEAKALERKKTITFPADVSLATGKRGRTPVSGSTAPIYDAHRAIIGTITVFQDITERHALDQMKNSFISVAAHQLRTPLGSMRWSMELLLAGDFGKLPKAALVALAELYSNSQRLVGIVNDLLKISRMESQHGAETRVLTDIGTIVEKALAPLRAGAKQRQVKIKTDFPKTPLPEILLSPEHIREALENLIVNAIRYTREDGTVTISAGLQGKTIRISIADTGIGIPEKEQANLFSKFFRASNAVLKETEGTGLGLSLVKSYLEESGGRISFESKENVGTTFFIEFPIDPAARIS